MELKSTATSTVSALVIIVVGAAEQTVGVYIKAAKASTTIDMR